MKRVCEYPLKLRDKQVLEMPREAQFLSVIEMDNRIVLYALINPDLSKKPYEVFLRGTENPIDDIYLRFSDFIGTVKMPDGFVWHIFVERSGL